MSKGKEPVKVYVIGGDSDVKIAVKKVAKRIGAIVEIATSEEAKEMGMKELSKTLAKNLVLLSNQTLRSPYCNHNSRSERRKRERLSQKKKR